MNNEHIIEDILDLCGFLSTQELEIVLGSIETMLENREDYEEEI